MSNFKTFPFGTFNRDEIVYVSPINQNRFWIETRNIGMRTFDLSGNTTTKIGDFVAGKVVEFKEKPTDEQIKQMMADNPDTDQFKVDYWITEKYRNGWFRRPEYHRTMDYDMWYSPGYAAKFKAYGDAVKAEINEMYTDFINWIAE